ncbi:hypothetical protein GCM10011517_00180 [Actibacterium pelagium]|uniref:Uncharacterized protein n=1 Tax=Actibacterium pelagium TaxID=2029103 RepID=A0A917EFW5_9RHOB|nr:hypothetical protein GCM10011517_00180 [Actibacterium pelagium]
MPNRRKGEAPIGKDKNIEDKTNAPVKRARRIYGHSWKKRRVSHGDKQQRNEEQDSDAWTVNQCEQFM